VWLHSVGKQLHATNVVVAVFT